MLKKGTKKMNIEYFRIAGGNDTAFVVNGPEQENKQVQLAGELLRQNKAEQAGFLDLDGSVPSLKMMGGELSINGTLAFARKLGGSGTLRTSGLTKPVEYFQENGNTTIKVVLPYQRFEERLGTIIAFEGIGYLCTDKLSVPQEDLVRDLWAKYNEKLGGIPAFGLAMYRGDRLEPYVYVRKTDSLVPESACGSGSVAVSIVTGQRFIAQRDPKFKIEILKLGDERFMVSARVDQLRSESSRLKSVKELELVSA